MSDVVIDVKNVTIRFNMASEKIDNLKEYFVKLVKRELLFQEFLAVKDASFQVHKGEAWGLVGSNGSGKSTLLKAICGVLKPYKGEIIRNGNISPLLELGAGFDPNLTARENIFLNGALLGYSREMMNSYYDEIVEFSELQNFMDVPVKNFSSGMVSRLAFAIATIGTPDIMIVDEVLSVGDFRFQQKCEARIRSMMDRGTTILFVSHSIEQVESICNKVVWLDHGVLKRFGDAEPICSEYKNS